ncbi:uncharacterized protein LOC127852888 [Dreissena polymorpha]|uniref:uncharacterized protein LOC127852888 n=1 Tax=Dreissena polymorpha TaxID=45954 RepID=UPI0022655E76|nr:uncharacterized protein LOC127852888 [Dreissena polymorpha]
MFILFLKPICIVILFLQAGTTHGFNCTGQSDGLYEASCQTAIKCEHETEIHISCTIPKVVNELTGNCDNPFNVNSPCGTFRDCSILDDGGYPDLEAQCHWYYQCSYGIFYGHHKCAGGLVWNTKLQTCDFERNVEPPCGTRH